MNINLNLNQFCGKIKPMHGVGQPPMCGIDSSYMHYLKEANIPYSRLHDVGGLFGGNLYVDIPNIFRDFSADVNDPNSYTFEFTDIIIKSIFEVDCEPIFRLGVTIENYCQIKSFRINPPSDYDKWAKICEHIISHYIDGWDNGFHYDMRYFEIWNEPDLCNSSTRNEMWTGTKEEYFKLYETASKHLKKCFGDRIKIGGPASSGFYGILGDFKKYNTSALPSSRLVSEDTYSPDPIYTGPDTIYRLDFQSAFLDFVKETNSPMDFYSWHSYGTVAETAVYTEYVHRELGSRGFNNVETQINEWNNGANFRGTSFASSEACAMMISQQHNTTDILCYYDARMGRSIYGGLFNPFTREPLCTYYAFKAFGELYVLGNECKLDTSEQCDNIYALCASDGEKSALLITNTAEDKDIKTNLDETFKVYLVNDKNFLTEQEVSPKSFTIKKNDILLVKNY